MKPQTLTVLAHLKSGRSLTALEALKLYGSFRLAARVEEIRSAGYAITTTLVRRGERRFARYRLAQRHI